MCGRFTLRTPGNLVIQQLGLTFQGEFLPRYNIAPTQQVPVARGHQRVVSMLHWGLIPFWAKDPKGGARLINARCETVASKPSFRTSFRQKRCLVPADGYFEWRREGKQKQPYWIRIRDEHPFLMAGLWDRWEDPHSEQAAPIESFTILTTCANPLTAQVHNRMPVILYPTDYDAWLNTDHMPDDQFRYLFEPYDEQKMTLTPVSTRVNSVLHDDLDCVTPATPRLF